MTTLQPPATPFAAAGQRLARLTPAELIFVAVVVSGVVAGISLFVTSAIDYDPDGWIVYAREVFGHGVLDTNTFPSWKPLPVLLIGPFTLISHGFADVYWWLWISRTCGVLAVFGVAALSYRLAGRWGAVVAASVMLMAPWWFVDTVIGRDSAPCAALIMTAIICHYRGWTRPAGIALVAMSLLRPEAAAFAGLYGLWAWRTKRLTLIELAGAVAVMVIAWEVPSILHAGKSPGSLAAAGAFPGTAVYARIPFLIVLKNSAQQMRQIPCVFVLIAGFSTLWGLLPVGRGTRFASLWGRDWNERVLIAFAVLWVLMIAGETQFLHFSGNVRYQVPGLAVWCLIAGVTAIRTGSLFKFRGSSSWGVAAVVVVMIIPDAILCHRWEHQGVALIQQREAQVRTIDQELAQQKCPGYAWTDSANNAYLAVIKNQSLPASIVARGTLPYFLPGHRYYFIYCAPPGYQPRGKA